MKKLKNISLALLSTLIMTTQSSVAEVLTDTQLHATLGIVTHFILDDSITHNGTTYGKVTSPYTGRVWLDRNLGASKVCASLDDTACYGDYYQWGRNADEHQKSSSFDVPTLANNVTNVGHGDFITTSLSPHDWASVDANGATRSVNWTATDGSSVCPVGFRVPTIAELKGELLDVGSAEIANNTDAFNSFLRLPSAGYKKRSTASMESMGSWGYIWSSSVNSNSIFFSGASLVFDTSRSYGFSVRCIEAQTHNHNGRTYGEVISPRTGKIWLDRNLGAKRVCTAPDDTECYGDYYQWGRNADGHQKSTSNTTSTLASNITNVGHGDFIINGAYPSDWASVDLAGAGRSANWSATDGSSVCPVGFRVPTLAELEAELIFLPFSSFLVMPKTGYRQYTSGSVHFQASKCRVWASSVQGFNAHYHHFSVDFENSTKRTYGFTVRCLKN